MVIRNWINSARKRPRSDIPNNDCECIISENPFCETVLKMLGMNIDQSDYHPIDVIEVDTLTTNSQSIENVEMIGDEDEGDVNMSITEEELNDIQEEVYNKKSTISNESEDIEGMDEPAVK